MGRASDDGAMEPAGIRPLLLELDRVSVCRGDNHLLRDVSLTLPHGRHTVILGPNGAGKTSLLRVLERELYPSIDASGQQGRVRILGRSDWDVSELRRRMGIVSAMLDRDFSHGRSGHMTAAEAVASGFTATSTRHTPCAATATRTPPGTAPSATATCLDSRLTHA